MAWPISRWTIPPANTYTHEMMRQIDDCVLKARFDKDVYVIVIKGEGDKFFCAGANINMLKSSDPYFKYYFCLHANETLNRLEQTPKLVIAALEGHTRRRRPRDRHGGGHPDRQEEFRQGRPPRGHPRRAPRHRRHPAARPPRRQEPVDRADGHRPPDRLRGGAADRHRQQHLRGRRLPRPGPRVRQAVLPAEQGGQGGRPDQARRCSPAPRSPSRAASPSSASCSSSSSRARTPARAWTPTSRSASRSSGGIDRWLRLRCRPCGARPHPQPSLATAPTRRERGQRRLPQGRTCGPLS